MPVKSPIPGRRDPMDTMDRNRSLLAQGQGYVFKELPGGIELVAWVFLPAGHSDRDRRPAVLFFFSSAWDSGLVSQFAPHCLHFAQRGVVAIAIEYRTGAQHGAGPLEAMADARSAVRWVRENAADLGVDARRVIGAGGAAGAHAILSAAVIADPVFDDPDDPPGVSCVPDALVLFDVVVDTASPGEFGAGRFPSPRLARLASPARHIRKGLPPMLLMHGTHDRLLPFEATRAFAARMRRWPRRNDCRLVPFEGCGHSFFNFNVNPRLFEATLTQADRFLVDLGYLAPPGETEVRL
jgi:acetyl esterase/lipase